MKTGGPVEISEQIKGAVRVIRPVGALTGLDAEKVKSRATLAASASLGKIVLDAGAIPFVDGRGLEVLVELSQDLGATGQVLKLAAANESLREVMELTEITGHFEHYEDANAAVRSFL